MSKATNIFNRKYNLLLARAVLVIIALLVCGVFYYQNLQHASAYQREAQQVKNEAARFKRLNDEKALVDFYAARFDKLKPVEQFTSENRLALLDKLENLQKKYQLEAFSYQIEPQKAYKYSDGVLSSKGLKAYSSDITLKFGVLHESQLLQVLDEVRKIKPQAFMLNGCDLELIDDGKAGRENSTYNIKANCSLRWYSFRL